MKPIVLAVIIIVGCAAAGLAYYQVRQPSNSDPAPTALGLPTTYKSIKPGESEAQVIAALGKPVTRTVNPKFQVKTDAQWAQIAAEARQSESSSASGAVSIQAIKLGAQLDHRIKETLRYQPNGSVDVTFAFDGRGRLLRSWALAINKPMH